MSDPRQISCTSIEWGRNTLGTDSTKHFCVRSLIVALLVVVVYFLHVALLQWVVIRATSAYTTKF